MVRGTHPTELQNCPALSGYPLPVIGSGLNDVFVLPGGRWIWAVGDEGMIVHSKDGGQTWEQQTIQSQTPPLQPKTLSRAWPALLQEAHAGEAAPSKGAQARQQPQIQSPVQQFPDKGSQGSVVSPSLQPIANPTLQSVFFIDEQRGWVVGEEGTILTTADGGATWMPQTSGTTADLRSVQMQADGQRGWVVGYGATLLNTVVSLSFRDEPQANKGTISQDWGILPNTAVRLDTITVPRWSRRDRSLQPPSRGVVGHHRRGEPDPRVGSVTGSGRRKLS